MNEITRKEILGSQRLACLESPSRRLLIKGMTGLGATLASSSLSAAIAAQTQGHQPATPDHQVSPVQGEWGPFTPSNGAGRYLRLVYPPSTNKGGCNLVSFTLYGSLTISRP